MDLQTDFQQLRSFHTHSCAGSQTKGRIWTLIGRRDDQCVVPIADLVVQLFHCSDPPLNTHTHSNKVDTLLPILIATLPLQLTVTLLM